MKKLFSLTWRLLVAAIFAFSLASAISAPSVAAGISCPIPAPINPIPGDDAILQPLTPRFSWTASTGVTEYHVYVCPQGQTPWSGTVNDDYNRIGVVRTNYISWPTDMSSLNIDWETEDGTLDYCSTYNWQVVANGSTCANGSAVWSFTTIPQLIGAVTGWTWEFPYTTVDDFFDTAHPYNTNDRNTIMVVFDGCSNAASFSSMNFKVTYNISVGGKMTPVVNETPKAVVHHSWWEEPIDCKDQGYQNYDLVFLTVAKPMATNSTPTVYIMNGATVMDQTVADDGIAPMLELNISGSPYTGGNVKITVNSSEPLWEASMAVNKNGMWDWSPDIPTVNLFPALVESPDEYGGYCTWFRDLNDEEYTDLGLMRVNGSTATKTFTMDAQNPQDSYFVEVYAHDMTWCNFPQACEQYWWRHEKWSSASQFFTGTDVIELHLVEGWNLISFPRTPVNPNISDVFGHGVINKIYTYNAGKWSGAIYNIHTGLWTTPAGLTALTTLQGGVGYWVYCSAAGEEQEFYSELLEDLAELYSDDPDTDIDVDVMWSDVLVYLQPAAVGAATLPTYPLTAGWNLVGVPIQGSMDQYQIRFDSWFWTPDFLRNQLYHAPVTMATDFLTGLDWNAIYWYLPPVTVWDESCFTDTTYTFPSGYQVATPETTQSFSWKLAFWMGTMGSGISIFPQTVPDWVIAENTLDFSANDYEGNDYNYCNCGNDGPFWFDTYGYTDNGEEIEISIDGYVDHDTNAVSGSDDGDSEVYNSATGEWEDIAITITGSGSWYDEGDTLIMTGTFTGVTETGRTITGTFVIEWDEYDYDGDCEYYYDIDTISFSGTITDENSIGNFVIDDAIMEDIAPVVIPGYGYWVYLQTPGTQIPAPATFSGAGITIGDMPDK